MIRRKPKVISAFELRRLSVVLFVSTQRQGSSRYCLKKTRHVIEKWELDTDCAKDTETNPHTVTYRKRIEQSYALGIWQHDQVPSKAQVVQQL